MITDRRWMLWLTALVVFVVEIPYLFAFSQAQRGWYFVGMLWSPHDFVQYAAAMRQGSEGAWLVTDQLTSEAHQPAFIYVFYVLLGKIAALTGLDPRTIYHLAELPGRATLVVSAFVFSGLLFQSRGQRRLGTLMILFSAGVSVWMLTAAAGLGLREDGPLFTGEELKIPEVSTFLVMFTAPHLTVGLSCILLLTTLLARADTFTLPQGALCTTLLVIGVAVTNPFSLLTICAVTVVWSIWTLASERPKAVRVWAVVGAVLFSAAPFVAYNALVFGGDAFWGKTYGEQNVLPPPAPLSILVGYGGLLAFAAVGARRFLPRPTAAQRLLLTWIILCAVMMYAPVSFGRRFAFGLHPVLALTATAGILAIWRGLRGTSDHMPWRARAYRSSLAFLLFTTTAFFYGMMMRAVTNPTDRPDLGGAFRTVGVQEAAEWLGLNMGPQDVVLGEIQTSNYIGGLIDGRSFIGHWVATSHFGDKELATRWFYSSLDADARQQFLIANGIRYVVYSSRERELGTPPELPLTQPVLLRDDVAIYEVVGLSQSTETVRR